MCYFDSFLFFILFTSYEKIFNAFSGTTCPLSTRRNRHCGFHESMGIDELHSKFKI